MKKVFTKDEIRTLFENDHVDWVDSILIMFFTGFRISELLSIKKTNIDIENMIIIGGGKTEAGTDRIVPIIPLIEKYVIDRYNSCTKYLFEVTPEISISSDNYRKRIYKPILDKLNIEIKMPHNARHTCGTIMAEARVDPLVIKSILGHTNYAFTANQYTHIDVDYMKKELKKISTVDYK